MRYTREDLILAYAALRNMSAVARAFNVAHQTIRWHLHRAGIDTSPNGNYISTFGYSMIKKPDHPRADTNGHVREHRLVMEERLGRYLTSEEQVHHIDGDRTNNHIDNLELFACSGDHSRHHFQGKTRESISADAYRREA